MIRIQEVEHRYATGRSFAFRDWQIEAGEKWLLLGDSGNGKSTLLHILTGILKPSRGEVIIEGTSIYHLPLKALDRLRGRQVGMVLQRPHLLRSLTVKENLLLAQTLAKLPEDTGRIEEVLALLGIRELKNYFSHQLSFGQLQRVSIARAVLNKPRLIVADEPTSGLDDRNTEAVLELLMGQSSLCGATLVVATHDKRLKAAFTNEYLI